MVLKNIQVHEIKEYKIKIGDEEELKFNNIREISEHFKISIGTAHNIIKGKKKKIDIKKSDGKPKIRT